MALRTAPGSLQELERICHGHFARARDHKKSMPFPLSPSAIHGVENVGALGALPRAHAH